MKMVKYIVLFREKGKKRWFIKSGTPYGGYDSKKQAMSFPKTKNSKYEFKVKRMK